MDQDNCPFVSIVMPIRNEADFIEKAIRGILENDYPGDKVEILVADGCSDECLFSKTIIGKNVA